MRRIPFVGQIVIGLVLGILAGLVSHTFGVDLKVLGDAFVRLIEMCIVPLIFPLIVLGVANMQSVRRLGRIAGKTILYFEIVTTVILVLAVVLGNVTGIGQRAHLPVSHTGSLAGFASGIDFQSFLLNIIPNNLFASLANGDLLPIVFFSLFLGLALAAIRDKAKPLRDVLESLSTAMFQVIEFVIKLTPIGVFGFIAYDTAEYGWSSLRSLLGFIGVTYLGMLLILLVVLPVVAMIFRVQYWRLLRTIGDLLLLAFVTRSSEVVLAPLTERLEKYGVDNSIVSFTLPFGYSFNLDGATLYEALAVLFLAHVYGVHLTLGHQFELILLLMILTKGLAGVPSAAIVVLIATAKSVGLPLEGITLLLGIDFIIDMARTAVNVVGNALAAVIVAKSEDKFHPTSIANQSQSGHPSKPSALP